jgi:hypothetical protein
VLDPLPRYGCYTEGDGVFVVPDDVTNGTKHAVRGIEDDVRSMVIIGGGPAGVAAAQTLREEGFTGRVTLISKEADLPYDRTKMSKNLAMKASEVGLSCFLFCLVRACVCCCCCCCVGCRVFCPDGGVCGVGWAAQELVCALRVSFSVSTTSPPPPSPLLPYVVVVLFSLAAVSPASQQLLRQPKHQADAGHGGSVR